MLSIRKLNQKRKLILLLYFKRTFLAPNSKDEMLQVRSKRTINCKYAYLDRKKFVKANILNKTREKVRKTNE